MGSLIKSEDPIELIKRNTTAKDSIFKEEFITVIQKCYQYAILKPFMDLVVTVCLSGRLNFEIFPKEFYMLDEGNCKTLQSFGGASKKYTITIRKISSDVIIHEIGHMLENEAVIILDRKFSEALYKDLTAAKNVQKSLQMAIKDVLIDQVRAYPDNQKNSVV